MFGGQRYGKWTVGMCRGETGEFCLCLVGSGMASGLLGCAEGERVSFVCVWWAAVWRHFEIFGRLPYGKKFCGLKLMYVMHKDSVRSSQRTLLHQKKALLNSA